MNFQPVSEVKKTTKELSVLEAEESECDGDLVLKTDRAVDTMCNHVQYAYILKNGAIFTCIDMHRHRYRTVYSLAPVRI